jgi:hypothetical protein
MVEDGSNVQQEALTTDLRNEELTNIDKNAASGEIQFEFFLLNTVAVIWGSQHVVIKSLIEDTTAASTLNFWRFFLSSLLFLPALLQTVVGTLS